LALDEGDAAWVKRQLETLPAGENGEEPYRFIAEYKPGGPVEIDDWNLEMPEYAGFDFDISDETLYISSMESGDVQMATYFIWLFIKERCNKVAEVFEWANTCSKPRVGEFGGGSVFITADATIWDGDTAELYHAWLRAEGDPLKFEILRSLSAIKAGRDAKSRIEKLVGEELSDDHEHLLMDLSVAGTMDSQTLEDFANELRAKD
jgi:hypothetical protein